MTPYALFISFLFLLTIHIHFNMYIYIFFVHICMFCGPSVQPYLLYAGLWMARREELGHPLGTLAATALPVAPKPDPAKLPKEAR